MTTVKAIAPHGPDAAPDGPDRSSGSGRRRPVWLPRPSWPRRGHRAVLGVGLLAVRVVAAGAPLLTRSPGVTDPDFPLFGLGIAAVLIVGNAVALTMVATRPGDVPVGPTVAFDVLVAYAAAMVADLTLTPPGLWWGYLAATVALWTVLLGRLAGVLVLGGWFAAQVSLLLAQPGTDPPAGLATQAVLLAAGLAGAAAAAHVGPVVDRATDWSAAVQAGREVEQRETRRWLHDGIVQTLEAIALQTDRQPSPEVLAEIRRLARDDAAALRRRMTAPEVPSDRLLDALREMAATGPLIGLRIRLHTDRAPERLAPGQVAALRGATAEAVANARKHAGVDAVDVTVTGADAVVRVEVVDTGAGFDPATRPPGFGISESISGRLREAGGGYELHSRPGEGTRVVMWVPR
jgi:signal transduction histidine kinase